LRHLVSVTVTEDELATLRRRRGYWLRLAREQADMDQNSVARAIGMSPKSGTSVLAWEKGTRSPTADQLHQLARIYNVPVSLFTEPRPTDEEWLAQMASWALASESVDWRAGERGRGGEDGPDEPPERRSA
jgi:transcriptional regulator with XRE-family HTH domain